MGSGGGDGCNSGGPCYGGDCQGGAYSAGSVSLPEPDSRFGTIELYRKYFVIVGRVATICPIVHRIDEGPSGKFRVATRNADWKSSNVKIGEHAGPHVPHPDVPVSDPLRGKLHDSNDNIVAKGILRHAT